MTARPCRYPAGPSTVRCSCWQSILTSARPWVWARPTSSSRTAPPAAPENVADEEADADQPLAQRLEDAERAARSKTRAEEMLAQKNLDKRDMELAEARLKRALVRSSVAARKDI